MRTTALLCLLLILPWQQLYAQDAESDQAEPEVEVELSPSDSGPSDPGNAEPLAPGEPEVILEPPDSQDPTDRDAADQDRADNSPANDQNDEAVADVPSRVARLSLIEGEVSVAPAGTEELVEAVLNRPLTSGDRVLVDTGGRAELQLGSATIYLDGGSGLSFVELSDGALRVSLTEGTAVIHVRRKRQDEEIEVATPNTTIALLGPGEYSIDTDPNGARTTLKTRSGEAQVFNERESFTVRARRQVVFTGARNLSAQSSEMGERTAFEALASERERRDLESNSAKYVSRDVIGYEDLDEHGDWVEEPEYGHVWRPRLVDAGWVPYRHGRWAYIAPWGWTWIDHARWGFAPFHYGRWAYLQSRWCWVPGPRHFRPIYGPAFVGWTGRSTFGASLAFGSGVGWFPLAPREVFVPSYRYSPRYARNLNVSNTFIVNTTFINNIYRSGGRHGWRDGRQSAYLDYRYRNQARAVTLVDRDIFVGGRGIDGRFRKLDARQWRRGRHDGLPPALGPQRSSLLAGRSVQRTGWQERFSRAERQFGAPRGARNAFDGNRSGERRQAWQNGGSQRAPVASNGLAPQRRSPDSQQPRRWQDGGQRQLQPGFAERADSDNRGGRRFDGNGQNDRQQRSRRWQDGGDSQQRPAGEPRRQRGAETRQLAQGDGAQRWQDRGNRGQQPGNQQPSAQQQRERRWQDAEREQQRQQSQRSGNQGRDQRGEQDREQGRERRQQQDHDQQQQQQRWQDRGQQQQQRWQDRGQESGRRQEGRDRGEERRQSSGQQQNREQARPQRDEGRRGWQQQGQQRSDSGRGQQQRGGGQSRWQR